MPKKKGETIPISDNLYTIAICAVRYALGRRTYMLGLVSTNGQHLTTPTGHFAWGVADYNRELNQEEVDAYELEFVEETDAD